LTIKDTKIMFKYMYILDSPMLHLFDQKSSVVKYYNLKNNFLIFFLFLFYSCDRNSVT